ncbi:lipoyltransferase 1, mitochondrial [Clupea harengus]|uniref:Lipoyl amidotransferase LIPT1, mitochondrial n=1 Tax=Clupea harengus TaxID=7950 RepID=A0A6P3VL28_CLUHA|nr:lipoyltransferase 1, mitochondrial [Clupea harengus]
MITRTLCHMCLGTRSHTRWLTLRFHSTLTATFADGKAGTIIKSVSTNIFENLALEDWIHDNIDLQKRSILYLWRNTPTVVIGRHQNPWQECNLKLMTTMGMPLARRRSGGGTVFHDLGNINMTFFTSKKNYDRHRNLSVVTNALKTLRPGLDVQSTERFDILLNGQYKISGTAAKLGRSSAYHHCTLLCSADRSVLSSVLKSTYQGIKSNATPSVPSSVKNLFDEDPTLDSETIMTALASQYNMEFGFDSPIYAVDPGEEECWPGIQNMAQELQTWEWVYGRTPKFSVCTNFDVHGLSSSANITLNLDIKNGIIENCVMDMSTEWLPKNVSEEFGSFLKGCKFCPNEMAMLVAAFLRVTPLGEYSSRMYSLCENVIARV